MNEIIFAFGLTLLAGLSTGVGSIIAFFAKSTNKRFLSISLGFSAGVMIYVSMVEIFFKANESLISSHGETLGSLYTVLAFFGGILLIAIIDFFIPENQNPHEIKTLEQDNSKKLMKLGLTSALAITIHNFPEGLATFITALHAPELAIGIVVAIALHNIPEGIAISVPIYQATNSKKKAFIYSFMSGLAEPIGALIGWLVLMPFINDTMFGILFAMVAGIMIYISLDELLPAAKEFGNHHLSMYGLISGMFVMAISLLLF